MLNYQCRSHVEIFDMQFSDNQCKGFHLRERQIVVLMWDNFENVTKELKYQQNYAFCSKNTYFYEFY